jgi:hypothetical protein
VNKSQRESRGFSPRPQIASAEEANLTSPERSYRSYRILLPLLCSHWSGAGSQEVSKRVPWSGWGMLVLAAAGSYSRVYVGVHYPTHVLAGVGLEGACGWG